MSLGKVWKKLFQRKNEYESIRLLDEEFQDEKGETIDKYEELEERKITTFNAFWNISNSIQGVAILAMPYVVKGGGWWSIAAIVIVAVVSDYTGQILIKCHYEDVVDEDTGEVVAVRTRDSYAEVGGAIFPVYGKNFVLVIQVLELLFMATLYPIVFVSIMKGLFTHVNVPSAAWVFIFGILMLPNVFLRQLYHISFMSSLTVASATAVFLAISLYCFTEAGTWHVHNLNEFSPKEFIAAVGVVVASYSSQMYLSVIEADMREPSKIGNVMNAGYTAMTLLKIGIGIIAYMTFGDETRQVVTLNLPSGFILSAVNAIVIILAMSSYTLPMFTVFEILEKDSYWLITGDYADATSIEDCDTKEMIRAKAKLVNIRRTAIRICLVVLTLVLAVSVPHFCLVLSFIGSFTGAFLEMVFPCCFYVILKYKKISKWTIILNIIIIFFSLLFMGIGMYFSAISIVKAFKLHTKEVWTVD